MDDTKSDHLLPPILGPNGVSSDQMTSQFCVECSAELLAPRCNQCGAAKVAGEFTILKLIAARPSGRVYLAEGPKGLRVALKELAFSVVPHIEDLDRFERGSELLRQLSHPGIPRFLAAFHVGEGVHTRLYVAAEYVEGENLLEMLHTYRFSAADVREIALQVLAMLEYLHNLSPRILHRDIKPSNLIRQHDGQIKLVDFDNARSGSPARIHDSTLVGTFGYIPLEQLGGTVDQTSDLYALGTTLIHLLSRKAPSELLQPDMSLRFEDAVNAPKLAPWIARLVARNPLERFASALEARAALDQLESSTPSLIPSAASPPAHQLPAQTDTLKSERLSAAPHLSRPIARAHIELYLESYQSWLFIAATSCFLFVVFLFTLLTYDGLSKKSGSWANLLWFIWFGGLSIIPLILRRVFLKWSLDREGVGDGELAWLDWAKARLDADFEEQVIQFDKSNVKAAVEYVIELQKETLHEHRPSE